MHAIINIMLVREKEKFQNFGNLRSVAIDQDNK